MAFQVIYRIEYKDESHLSIEDFLSTLDMSVIADFPEFNTGSSVLEVYNADLKSQLLPDSYTGLIDTKRVVEPLATLIIQTWTSKEAFEQFAATTTYITDEKLLLLGNAGRVSLIFPADLNLFKDGPVSEFLNVMYGNQYCTSTGSVTRTID